MSRFPRYCSPPPAAADQKLLEPAEDLRERRTAFLAELGAVLQDMERIEQISRENFAKREARIR
jgi:glycerol-3-phosphate O-acyltransferase